MLPSSAADLNPSRIRTSSLPATAGRPGWTVALGWWVIAGALGVLLRYLLVSPVDGLTYLYLLHTHSHVVLLGWTFNALFLALQTAFPPPAPSVAYRRFWAGFQVAVAGMLVLFPIQGYAAGSIAFSTLHVLLSYYLCVRRWRDLRGDRSLSARLLRWGLVFLVVSTLGPYALGALKARQMQETIWYNLSIYYYLHFLYNGWFVFGCLALLLRWVENRLGAAPTRQAIASGSRANGLVALWVLACLGTVALSALWTAPPAWVWALGAVSGWLQLVAAGWLLALVWPHRTALGQGLAPGVRWLGGLAALAFGGKLLLQAFSALPWAAAFAYAQRPVVIAYLHLVFIGFISFFLLAWAIQHRTLRYHRAALNLLIFFFILHEFVLIAGPLAGLAFDGYLPHSERILLVVSVGMWLSVCRLWWAQRLKGS